MPSPPEEERSKRDSGQNSDSNTHHPPPSGPPQQPPPPGHQPAMGYGYPGYPPSPYSNYPNQPYNYQYAYAQAPPPTYYGSTYPIHQNPNYRPPPPSGFFRGILAGLIILAVLFCISTIITWFIFRPQIPTFTLTRFAVSGFNVTGPVFSAQWTANLTVENSNTKLKGYFDRIQSFIYYKSSSGDDEFLATAFFPPVYVDTGKTAEMGQTLTEGDKEQPMVPSWVVEEMKKERASGTIPFSLRMAVSSRFKSNEFSTRQTVLKVFCENLKVAFDGDSGNGNVSLPKPLRCLVYI